MGWADCGTDSKGRPIGYVHLATCDHPGCNAEIDRGLSYACGGMHGQADVYCEGYYCPVHLIAFVETSAGQWTVCSSCRAEMEADPDWYEDREEGVWRHKDDE